MTNSSQFPLFINDFGTYNLRTVGRNNIKGLTISTAYTSNCGYETAIIDANGIYVVERYANIMNAEAGHLKWLIESETIENVIKLGLNAQIGEKTIKITKSEIIALKRKSYASPYYFSKN